MRRNKYPVLVILAILLAAFSVFAAELKNEKARQEGNRFIITYDLETNEKDAEVNLTITVDGKIYKASELHVEGDVGKVKPGRGKRVSWNILQDFPRGLRVRADWELSTTTGMEMIFVKGGCYQMGDTFGDGQSKEKPVHEVCVNDFYIGKFEVTQGQWQRVMGNNPSSFKNCGDNCPVESVSWSDAQEFIRKLNNLTGKNYRLPTEAEWEYAARSGGKSEKFAGGNDVDAMAWYEDNSGSKTHPVGQKQPNGLGLYDMSGNVWEWCSDWHGENYYNQSPRGNPEGPSSGFYRVERGGSCYNSAKYVRAALRYWDFPAYRSDLGFRLALPPGQ